MSTSSKKVTIFRVTKSNNYSVKNAKVLTDGSQKIGGSISAKNAMLVHDEELKSYMPKLIGVSPASPQWQDRLDAYFESLTVMIPDSGFPLEVGFVYNYQSENSKKLVAANRDVIKSEGEFSIFVDENISDEERYLYGTPINIANYVLYRYCKNYKPVANTIDDVEKSKDIRFYLVDETYMKKRAKALLDLKNSAKKIYLEVSTSPEKVKNLIFAMGRSYEIVDKDDFDTLMVLERISNDEPQLLIDAAKDKMLDSKAFIERCIDINLLTRQDNTSIIMVTADNAILGNTIEEAVVALNSKDNLKLKNELEMAIKGLPK